MKNKILATFGAATVAVAMSATASHAFVGAQPGGTSGLATGAPLPEGVFFIDEDFESSRTGTRGDLNLNIPIFIWSTPVTFYNTRLEVLFIPSEYTGMNYATGTAPGTIASNNITDGHTRSFNNLFAISLAHDFGNGFGASITPGLFTPNQAFVPHTYALIQAAVSYTGNGYDLTANFKYSGTFGSNNGGNGNGTSNTLVAPFPGSNNLPAFADAVTVDLTATKKFGNFEIGFVGYAYTDIENAQDNANYTLSILTNKPFGATGFTKAAAISVGGLVGYDFGKFTLQADVSREVLAHGAPQVLTGTGKETRGMLRLVLPLYVAPPAPAPVVAKY